MVLACLRRSAYPRGTSASRPVGGGTAPMISPADADLLRCERVPGITSDRRRVMVIAPGELRGPLAAARLQHEFPLPRRLNRARAWRDG